MGRIANLLAGQVSTYSDEWKQLFQAVNTAYRVVEASTKLTSNDLLCVM